MPFLNLRASNLLLVTVVIVTSLVDAGCTTKQSLNAGQLWQRNKCVMIFGPGERERCLNSTDATYEDFKRQSDPKTRD